MNPVVLWFHLSIPGFHFAHFLFFFWKLWKLKTVTFCWITVASCRKSNEEDLFRFVYSLLASPELLTHAGKRPNLILVLHSNDKVQNSTLCISHNFYIYMFLLFYIVTFQPSPPIHSSILIWSVFQISYEANKSANSTLFFPSFFPFVCLYIGL